MASAMTQFPPIRKLDRHCAEVRKHRIATESKWETIMNAYEFYLSTCKYVLLADPSKKSTWGDLYGYLPCLRQMLSCCVCGNIMLKPKGPSHGICLHHVCASCIGGKMRLRPACSWCRTHESFVENPGMRLLILCFKRMCEYINSSPIGQEIRKSATNGAHTNTLIKILDEAAAFEDDYVISNKVMPTCVPTYGMAPEPKLVSLPRGHSSGAGGRTAGGRVRSDSAASASSHPEKENPASPTQEGGHKLHDHRDKTPSTSGPLKLAKVDDELEKMPALLAPCTRGMDSQEKLSPPLPGTQRAESHELQGSNSWSALSRSRRSQKFSKPLTVGFKCSTVRSKGLSVVKAAGSGQSRLQSKSKLKNGLLIRQKNLSIKGKYQRKKKPFKHEIDFEPPCKRTRLASSMTTSDSMLHAVKHKACKCARLNAPSRLTCFGQRCPCYSNHLPCTDCMCRGCRNPRKGAFSGHRDDDKDKSDGEHDPPMPRLSPEPRM